MEEAEAGGESTITVLVALAANAAIAVAKTVAAVVTGSASLTAEAAHSWADAGNEVFLLLADRRSARPPDDDHPLGYGRDAYVWSLLAAVGIFTLGAAVSVQHGISELGERGPVEAPVVAYVVLAVSFVLESVSFLRSRAQLRRGAERTRQDVLQHVLTTSDPTVRAVFFEDAAALIGIGIAAAGILLHQITGSAVWDAAGSILIGLLLGVVAVFLIAANRRFLIGQAVSPEVRDAVLGLLLNNGGVARVTYLHLEFVGPARVFLVAAVDLAGDAQEHDVAARLGTLARGIESRPEIVRAMLTLSDPAAGPPGG